MNHTIELTAYQFEVVRLLAERRGQTPAEFILGFFGCSAPWRAVPFRVQCTPAAAAAG